MDLRSYLAVERGRGARLAAAIRVDPVMVSQWANGTKPIAFERCMPIERATDGQVRRWDLRPDDWHRHWPELIDAPGAPSLQRDLVEARDAA